MSHRQLLGLEWTLIGSPDPGDHRAN